MRYEPRDPYFRQAKAEGYLARSVYKLIEIDKRYRLLSPGLSVIDLGAAPGSWSQYLVERVGPTGQVVAIDRLPIEFRAPNLQVLQLDVYAPELEGLLAKQSWDGLLSDMAPATSGIRFTDQSRSAALVERSLELAKRLVRKGGFWVAKLLEGPQLGPLQKQARLVFEQVSCLRPQATRKGSTECFLIGLRKRQ